ncbi:hypothetical protein LMJ53_16340 [Rheinheimera sp. UJ51]|uniref:FGGY-family carbohydrate kinase n=1 Tax=unclassified Rheinheimera TaxID=115860 RepID=UPI001E29B37E|nr:MULTISPECIES: FGGY family carbohydrate kinase [unclassified Rheinheimera]MCC5453285.1 hypothetical protein [Rheinheimera sp. UJ51]MCF4010941.1 hypothetical protein [Rheinheimera sp. UJ63]
MAQEQMMVYILIIDIGKTHIKLHVLDCNFQSVYSKQMTNIVDHSQIYDCTDVNKIWQWLVSNIRTFAQQYPIGKITITTHGATAALIDREADSNDGLVLPVLDYESAVTYEQSSQYDALRDDFTNTYSPNLPAGLNLGRQLYWLKQTFPQQFNQVTDILMYPQYWVWRFTGQCFSEITSLGCHTDLWSIKDNDYSSLVDKLDCRNKFPPIQPAWHDCGAITSKVAHELGLTAKCKIYNGIHDSNASFLRYRLANQESPFTVISTGTWTILMATQVPLENLNPQKDMLANIDAFGSPVACARFMGGREFEAICVQAGSWLGEQFNDNDLQTVIDRFVFAIPDFGDGSGPFGNRQSGFVGPVDKVSGIALATLYCALMIDYQLSQLASKGKIYIEGAFLKNPLLCAVINQLRKDQKVYMSMDSTGTVLGAACLTNLGQHTNSIALKETPNINLIGLETYKEKWLTLVDEGH